MKTTYNLICMSFDGEYKIEKWGFDTVLDAWEHAEDMGSRWYFYPFCFVTSASGLTIVDAPTGLEYMKGRRVKTIERIFQTASKLPATRDMDVDSYSDILRYEFLMETT